MLLQVSFHVNQMITDGMCCDVRLFDMLRMFASALCLLVVMAVPSMGQTLKSDKEKSKVDFTGKKSDGAHVGGFKDVTAVAKVDLEAPEKGSLTIEIKTDSLWSDDEKLTGHLKNPDFFNVQKFPTIKFESTKINMNDMGCASKRTRLPVKTQSPTRSDVKRARTTAH